MREIKIRAWDKVDNVMLDWLILTQTTFNRLEGSNYPIIYSVLTDYNSRFEVMQFTGLKDKNGKDIYEGDILKISQGHPDWTSKLFTVVFYEGAFCVTCNGEMRDSDKPLSFITYGDACVNNGLSENFSQYLEKIGNIYENPNLI